MRHAFHFVEAEQASGPPIPLFAAARSISVITGMDHFSGGANALF
jgi:hypothetical protein